MIQVKFYLDSRWSADEASLKIVARCKGQSIMAKTGVRLRPEQWDSAASMVIRHPDKARINKMLRARMQELEDTIRELTRSGEADGMSIEQIRERLFPGLQRSRAIGPLKNGLAERFQRFAALKKEGTRKIYEATFRKIRAYAGDEVWRLRFEDISKDWLTGFDAYMARTAPSKNARNIHLRNIRSVFNDAIDNEITTFYPFRRFKIRPVPTAKRSLTVEQLRALFAYPVEEHARQYVDIFKLIFLLCGINITDLCHLRGLVGDRVEYIRAKTGRPYSIKVEPEAMEIIERYRGDKWLLNIMDRYKNEGDYMRRINRALQKIGPVERHGLGGKKSYRPLFPGLTTYWARHSWATMAAELDIPREIIAAGLGHGGNSVTDIYIRFDPRKVDRANRRVIDYVLHGIGGPEY